MYYCSMQRTEIRPGEGEQETHNYSTPQNKLGSYLRIQPSFNKTSLLSVQHMPNGLLSFSGDFFFFFASSQLPSIVSAVNSQQRFKVVGSYQHCSLVQKHREQEYIYVFHTVWKNVILCLVSYQQLLSQFTAMGNE